MVYKETTNINRILYFMFILLLNHNLEININNKNNDLVIWNYKILENQ